MEAKYLKDNLGCLTTCLMEVAERRPHDPIEYIAFWLRKHIANERLRINKEDEMKRLEKEKAEEAVEQQKREVRLEEARKLSEEEAARFKAEEEKRQREAASASKLPVVEEKDELTEGDEAKPAEGTPAEEEGEKAVAEETSEESKEADGDGDATEGEAGTGGEGETTTEGETTEQEGDKADDAGAEPTADAAEEES